MTDETGQVEAELESESAGTEATASKSAKGSWRSTIVALVLLVGVAAALNAPYTYQSLSSRGGTPDTDFDFPVSNAALGKVTEAGWPLRYYIGHRFDQVDDASAWFPLAALVNTVLAVGCIALACWYVRGQSRAKSKDDGTRSRRISLSLADLLVIVALIAMPMGYWQRQSHLQRIDKEVEKRLANKAVIFREVAAPGFLKDHLPNLVKDTWSRISRVEITDPNSEEMALVCGLPYLKSLRVGGGDYDLKHLQSLPSMRYLADLRIAGRELDSATVQLIASCPLVSQLNIAHTNCSNASLGELESMPRLQKLMAFGCAIDYSAWQQSQLREKLVDLRISRPETGEGGEAEFRQWPKLQSLALLSHDGFTNRNVFDVTVADMPNLDFLEIDVFQLVDLSLDGLPKLAAIENGRRNQDRRVADGERAPSFLWARNIRLNNLPKLEQLKFYCDGFQSIEFANCENLEKLIGTSMSQFGSEDFSYDYTLDKKYRQNLVDAFGKLNGPNLLGLYGHRLDDLDLSKLAGNKQVRALDFNSSVLSNKNIDALAEMQQLETFGFYKTRLEGRIVGRINKMFPKLKFLALHGETSAIRLEDKPNLEQITFADYEESGIRALRLVNLPNLTSPLIVSGYGQYCVVENVPQMKGLAILGSIPKAKLSDVGGLQWFVGGGETLTDQIVSEVIKAKQLKKLTLAYPVAGKDSFDGLLDLAELSKLVVPGAPLDDAAWQKWRIPDSLTDLNLEHCGLSAKSTERIIVRGRWSSLSLAGNEVTADSLGLLSESPIIARLSLGDVAINLPTIKAMPDLPSLTSLGLAGATLEKGVLAVINDKFYRLSEIDLQGATFDNKDLMSVIQANPKLKFKLQPTDANVQIITYLTGSNRLVRPQDPWMFPQRQVLGYDAAGRPHYVDNKESRTEFDAPELDLDEFNPNANQTPGGVPLPGTVRVITDPDKATEAQGSAISRALDALLGGNPQADPSSENEGAEGDAEANEETEE